MHHGPAASSVSVDEWEISEAVFEPLVHYHHHHHKHF